jgi:hypothetical protein
MSGRAIHIGGQSGSTLVAVLILSVVMLVLVLSVFKLASLDAALTTVDVERSRAFYTAEAGLERGRTWLEAQTWPPYETEPFFPFGEEPDTLGEGAYVVSIVPDPANAYDYPLIYTVSAVATVGRKARHLELDLTPQSFADFLYFTHEERLQPGGQPVWFVSPDRIDGVVHTNDQINIFGDPTFAGHVRSAYGGPDDASPHHSPSFQYYNGHAHNHIESAQPSNAPYDEPTFEDGYELGALEVALPRDAIDDFKTEAQAGGIYARGAQQVILARLDARGRPMHGYVSYRKNSRKPWTDVQISATNGIMFVNGHVELLGGKLDGQLTIASNASMTIQNDVTYRDSNADGPRQYCDDMLGLVCSSHIRVAYNAANRHDCVIHAHMISINNSFEAEQWSSGRPRGTLTVHGGICQKSRGAVGTGYLWGDRLVVQSGYTKDYHYDRRLAFGAPPGYELFLLTGRYRRLAWRDVSG